MRRARLRCIRQRLIVLCKELSLIRSFSPSWLGPPPRLPRFLLAHLTDPHLTPPPIVWSWRDLASKRLLSRLSWRRKRRLAHRPEVLAAIVADMKAHAPDHVALTGDVVNFAAPEEFAAAAVWFESLGAPADLTVSPGNHDALVARGEAERFAAWRPWFGDAGEGFPYLRRRGPVALINLRSGWPTPPLLSGGRLGAAQLERLTAMLRDCGEEGLVRIVLLHHPVAKGAASPRQALFDAPALRRTLKEHGAELVLHGHVHFPEPAFVAGPQGPIPVVGVSSASARSHGNPPARWHGIEVEGEGASARLQLVVRGFKQEGDRIGELERRAL